MADLDTQWMQRALELARRGIALTSPNPTVGCVLLDRAGQVAGEGWHEYEQRDHAEVAALKAAQQSGNSVQGGTAYVTLEPCNHTGRTPPCTQALIAAGISRVVAATIDPNPAVAGNGLQTLQAAGIQTSVGLCQPEARRLNEPFAHWSQSKRPFVLMKVAMTLDGRIAPAAAPHQPRQPHWITSEPSRAAVQLLRWQADAVLTGIDTVLADDPLLTDRSGIPRRRPLQRIVLDSTLRIPLDSKLVKSAQGDLAVFTVSNNQALIHELRYRGVRVEVFPAEPGVPGDRSSSTGRESNRVPLAKLLDLLGSEAILTLLTETGSRLNTALITANLVNRLHLFVSPQIMGADAVPAFNAIPAPFHLPHPELERHGDDLALSSLLNDPWPTTTT